MRTAFLMVFLGWLVWTATSCGGSKEPRTAKRGEEEIMQFTLTSAAFLEGGRIPDRYTCTGEDVSPPLKWEGAPEETKSFALVVEDPDAPGGTFIHWVLYNLPGSLTELPEGVPRDESLESGALQGVNDFRTVGYRGPCPPPGKPHRYFFILRALDVQLDLKPRATKAQLERAIQGHVLAEAKLMGTYSR